MRKNLLVLIVLLLSISASSIVAEFDFSTTGKIAGRITDASTGEALPFVNIIVMGTNYGTASDIDGYYSILNILPGTYEVKASTIEFSATLVKNVKVSIDLTTTVDLTLSETSLSFGEDIFSNESQHKSLRELNSMS